MRKRNFRRGLPKRIKAKIRRGGDYKKMRFKGIPLLDIVSWNQIADVRGRMR